MARRSGSLGAILGSAIVSLVVGACSRTGLLVYGAGPAETTEAGIATADGGRDATNEVGPHPLCVPRSCETAGYDCGENGDGCGGVIQCGACAEPDRCGLAGYSRCGSGPATCTPTSCQRLGFDCGPAADGCGGSLQCGTCPSPQSCGALAPWRCGSACTGLCADQVACDSGSTILAGRVVAGTLPIYGPPDPIYNALVYVANGPVEPFGPGVACNHCGADVSGNPLVETLTAADGSFSLQNVPAGVDIPLVIQLGRWRRQVTVPAVAACTTTALSQDETRLPRNRTEGDIPLTAIATGAADSLECVLMKLGVDPTEFTEPSAGGRVQMYVSNGVDDGPGTPPAEQLWGGNGQTLAIYDQVLLPCEGAPTPKASSDQQNLIAYSNAGGRVFTTHYGYEWLYDIPPFEDTAVWSPNAGASDNQSAFVDTASSTAQSFATWLLNVGALSGPGSTTLLLQQTRQDLQSVVAPSEELLYALPGQPLQYDFYTPVGQPLAQQCGRVFYSDFHVVDAPTLPATFPAECTAGPMSPQEKALEFLLFDLASCVPAPPSCAPQTCAQQGFECGPAGDGCGGAIQCGDCPAPQTCGGGGPGRCGGDGGCVPRTCAQLGYDCGLNGDGCGGVIECGTCHPPSQCGMGGRPSVCGG